MNKRKVWMITLSAILLLVITAGVLLFPGKQEPVAVYSMNMVGFHDIYSQANESSGMVKTDKVQTAFVSDTQKITEILVEAGQQVKEGDALYTYDTTLSDLALERKDLAIQQMEISLTNSETELEQLNAMQPMVIIEPPVTEPDPNKIDHDHAPADGSKLNYVYDGSGTSNLNPYFLWLGKNTVINDQMVENLLGDKPQVYVLFQISLGDQPGAIFEQQYGLKFTRTFVNPGIVPANETVTPQAPSESTEPGNVTDPTEETLPVLPAVPSYSISFFIYGEQSGDSGPLIDWNSGYTQAELESLRAEKKAQIKQLKYDIKMGKAELSIMRKEASDGKVYAEFDGTVVSVISPEEAEISRRPMLKISGGGGFYVEGAISEQDLQTIQVGKKIIVNSWENGQSYEGKIVKVGQYPSEDQNHFFGGYSNDTYYPYQVFIDESADLMEGSYVGLSYQQEHAGGGVINLQNAFIRAEGNKSYVFLKNSQGNLEKRYIQVGASADGYYTPVLSGLTMEDYVAFPYGPDLKEGAPVFEGTDQDLYQE